MNADRRRVLHSRFLVEGGWLQARHAARQPMRVPVGVQRVNRYARETIRACQPMLHSRFRKEGLGALVLRMVDNLAGGTLFHNDALVHEDDAIGHVTRE